MVAQADTGARAPKGLPGRVLWFVPLCWSLFQLWYASPLPFIFDFGVLNDTQARSIHLTFAVFLAFTAYPAMKGSPRDRIPLTDWLLALAGSFSAAYIYLFYAELAGRSNAGKSSSLNRLTNQKNLAKTSKTPGRTQLINLFKVADGCHIVDLPGYGFAQVPLEMKLKWQRALGEYLQKRQSLKGLVVLMDIRHPMKDLDQQLIIWAVECGIPVQVMLTKADKLKSGARKAQVLKVREEAKTFGGDVAVDAFSSLSGIGVDTLRAKLDEWYAPMLAALAEQEEGEQPESSTDQ